jgi:hypothetical protein
MQALTVRDRDAGIAGLSLVTDLPYPAAAENDVIVRVHAAGFTPRGTRLAGHLDSSVALMRAGGTVVTIAMPPRGPARGRAGRVRRRRTRHRPGSPRG